MKRLRLCADGGFTLIELLVVIAIIGILAAIAIPQFAAYRRRGYDSDVKSNVKNASTAIEAYYVDANTYNASLTDLTMRGYKQSTNVTLVPTGNVSTFIITGGAVQGCVAGTGTWYIQSATGLLTGTPCG